MKQMKNFENMLVNLIISYNIDEAVPEYRKYISALSICKKIENVEDNRVDTVFIVGSEEEKKRIQSIFRRLNVVVYEGTEKYCKYDRAFILSYRRQYEISNGMYNRGIRNVVRLYDFFEKEGIFFNDDFYNVFHQGAGVDPNEEYFYFRRMYENSVDKEIKKIYLKKVIFTCVFYYDFISLDKYIDEYQQNFPETAERYLSFRKKVRNLIRDIKQLLEERRGEDIFMVWLDQLEYGEDQVMPFLSSIDEKAVVFDRIYTVTPYTGATLKTLFAQKRAIEENGFKLLKITKEESALLRELDEEGYTFLYYGKCPHFPLEYKGSGFFDDYTPLTVLFWNAVTEAVRAEKKIFCVLHCIAHTHDPYVSFGISSDCYHGEHVAPGDQTTRRELSRQSLDSRYYTDMQLRYWEGILPSNSYKIYMSDHGHTFFGRFHPIMKIVGRDVVPFHYSHLISYFEFDKIINLLIHHQLKCDLLPKCEYIHIQDVDYYNGKVILQRMRKKDFSAIGLFGYQGIITKDDMFIKTFDGRKFYHKFINDGIMVTDERLHLLEEKMSKKRPDIYHESQFAYSRLFIQAEKNNRTRLSTKRKKEREIIKDYLRRITDADNLAIRGGGFHTLNLLMSMEEVLRKKVKYIIDRDNDCVASGLGIRVLDPCGAKKYDIGKILISTFQNRKEINAEFAHWGNICVVDLYELFSRKGLEYDRDYYDRMYVESDFEGFNEYIVGEEESSRYEEYM